LVLKLLINNPYSLLFFACKSPELLSAPADPEEFPHPEKQTTAIAVSRNSPVFCRNTEDLPITDILYPDEKTLLFNS
jgi:hypothetical protein